jgi:hypothetical protein
MLLFSLLTDRLRSVCIAALALAFLTVSSGGSTPSSRAFRVLESGPTGWVLQYVPGSPPPALTTIQGEQYLLFPGATGDPRTAGQPFLPKEVVSFGIPPGTFLTAELVEPLFVTRTEQRVAPVPAHRLTAEGEAVEVFAIAPEWYHQNAFFPEATLSIPEPFTLRHQRVGIVHLSPYQYNPVTRELRTLVRGKLRVTLHRITTEAYAPVSDDPAFEPLYKTLLCNYEQARAWRYGTGPGTVRDSTRDWFQTGRTYVHMRIGEDGWYRITTGDLARAGVDMRSVDPRTLTVLQNGSEIPVVVRPDTSVDFYALSNRGDGTGADSFTDTSAFWLTWGGPQGRRFIPSAQPGGTVATPIASVYASEHFEQNTGYFTGTTEEEVIETGEVPGEGWYWARIFPNTSFTTDFTIADTDPSPHMVALRVRLVSMTPDSPAVDHHARLWVNDSLAGEMLFEGRTAILTTDSFPSSWLRSGANTLRVSSLQTATTPNLFYLDWFEVGRSRILRASNDLLDFTAPALPDTSAFTLTGLSGAALEVRDLDGGREITGGVMSGDSVTGYVFVFRDTVSGPRRYHVGPAAGSPVPSLKRKQFLDLRANAGSADYLIITHALFRGAADRLAAYRALAGVRSRVVDVQDLFDEFAYGVENPGAIRAFLRFAFDHWPAPAPSSVLLLGDATWDPRRYLDTSRKQNFIPSHGVPASDNWFVATDTNIVPFMTIGRLPVEDSVQAVHTVEKIIGSETRAPGLWNKNFLMITGGTTSGEQETFNSRSEATISSFLAPTPIGGTLFRAYKSSDAVIDGEHREQIRSLIRDGLSFINFLGHSGGRVWGVDIGDPGTLENTDGRLPFVSSVSCNIAAFAEPSGNVLAEDLVLADHRGALAVWASSSLGYPASGTQLVNFFLAGVRDDSLRDLGRLTTQARYRLLQSGPADPIIRAMVQLNPLIGDPLSRFAVPALPDLAADAGGISVTQGNTTAAGIPVTMTVPLLNFGLVPAESTGVWVTDLFEGRTTDRVRRYVPPVFHRDSLVISWLTAPGVHTFRVTIDPDNRVAEVNEGNNIATLDQVVNSRSLRVLSPLNTRVVLPGPVRLAVACQNGAPTGSRYLFEIDTLSSFTSPARIVSDPVPGGAVTAEWLTPSLAAGRVFFWRAKRAGTGADSAWTTAAFSTSGIIPPEPVARLRRYTSSLLELDTLVGVAATDSGVTLAPQPSRHVTVRSLGSRADPARDYYSFIGVGDVTYQGRWGEVGGGFIVARVHPASGAFEFRSFDLPGASAEAESMQVFIERTPAGDYLAVVAILDGRTNVTPGLLASVENLGSTRLAGLLPGQSWALVARKGFPATAVEGLSDDSVTIGAVVPRTYAGGLGAVLGEVFPAVTQWDSLHWSTDILPGVTGLSLSFVAIRRSGGLDTLLVIPSDETAVSLSLLNARVDPVRHAGVRPVFTLRSEDVQVTPALREWSVDIRPPGDVALRAEGAVDSVIPRGQPYEFTVTLYNIGVAGVSRIPLAVSYNDAAGQPHPFGGTVIDTLPAGDTRTVSFPLETAHLPPRGRLAASVWEGTPGSDLIDANNTASGSIVVSGPRAGPIRLFSGGRQIVEGDYVAAEPVLTPGLPEPGDPPVNTTGVGLTVDGVPVPDVAPAPGEHLFRPAMRDGGHVLELSVFRDGSGFRDTLSLRVGVQVETTTRIVQPFAYPNPFARETAFTFMLTGAGSPEELMLRVFSVTGRRLLQIVVPGPMVNVGFNRVAWDGRDADGDEVANGVYFYQLSVRGSDGRQETVTGKVARVR